jgi:tetratricopeptide (TPR) repeat protein
MPKRPPPAHDRPSTIAEALERAALAIREQRLAEAERLAADVVRSSRGNVPAAQLLGQALLLQGRPQEAIDPLQRAARRSHDPAIETLLARALAETGRGEAALDQLRQATARRPPYPLAFLELGDQLGKLGRFDEALAVFESGLALNPDAAVLRVGLGYLHLHRNDRASARALFLAVRDAAPERHDALVALANAMALDGDYAGAAELYRHALARRPDDAMTRISLGKCLLEMGERDDGEAALRAAARGSPRMVGPALAALAATAHGRFFLTPGAAAKFLRAETA